MSSNDQGPFNPWGPSGGGNGQNPWGGGSSGDGGNRRPGRGNGGGGNGDMPPDFEELLRRAEENFRSIFPGSGGFFRAVLLAILAVLGLWLASGFYFIQPNENGVVLTFGRYTRTDEQSGLKYILPWPIQQVHKVDVTSQRRVEIGGSIPSTSSYRQVVDDESASLMLTGDENIIDINFVVMWRIGDAREFLFELREPEETIRMVAQSAIREIIGQTKITSALTDARESIQNQTRDLMQKVLDEYQSGVTINSVQLLKVDPPGSVIDAFNDVQRARAEAERMQNEAAAYRNDILPRARGAAQKTLQDAQAYKQEVIAKAKGDAERFTSVYAAYSGSKTITSERMYLETMEEVLKNAKTIVLDQKGSSNVLPYLPLQDMKRTVPPMPREDSEAPTLSGTSAP